MGAQFIVATILNLAVAVAVGAVLLAHGRRPFALGAIIVALLASVALLWLEAALMAGVPLAEAAPAAWSMLTATHFGFAWKIGAVALIAAGVLLRSGRGSLLALAVFLYSRSMVSHAAADGDIGLAIAIDWMHLMAISVWIGAVLMAAWVNTGDIARHARSLSTTATIALAVVVATGLFNAWRHIGSIGDLTGHPYGAALLIKLAFVGLAVALGGYNRLFVMPGVLAGASARRFVLVLRVEAIVLAIVMALAAILGATSPPNG